MTDAAASTHRLLGDLGAGLGGGGGRGVGVVVVLGGRGVVVVVGRGDGIVGGAVDEGVGGHLDGLGGLRAVGRGVRDMTKCCKLLSDCECSVVPLDQSELSIWTT